MSVKHVSISRRSTGFTLIEVLVAILILAVGILGLVRLQGTAIQQSNIAMQRTQATLLGYDIANRIRANRDEAKSGGYDSDWSEVPVTVDCSVVCSAAQLAQHDIAEWLQAVARKLPEGDGQLSVTNNVATIEVRWRDIGADAPVVVAVRTKI